MSQNVLIKPVRIYHCKILDIFKKICLNKEKLAKFKTVMAKKAFVDLGNLVTPSLLELYKEFTLDKLVFSSASDIGSGDVNCFDFKNLPMLSCKEVDWHRDWEGHTLLWVLESHGHILQVENQVSNKIISKELKFGDLICFNLDHQHRLITSDDSVSNSLFVTLSWDLYAFQLRNGYKIKKWEDIARILLKEKQLNTELQLSGLVNHFAKIPSKSVVLTQWERLPNSETEVLRECNKPLKTPYIWAKLSPYYSRFRVLPHTHSDQDHLNWFTLPSSRQQTYAKCKKQIEDYLSLGKHLVVQ